MKRTFINAFAIAIVGIGGTQLTVRDAFAGVVPGGSDYTVCMDYCMAEGWGFHHCHSDCKGLADAS